MSPKMYQKVFRKYYKESMCKMYLDTCSDRVLIGLMTWDECVKEHKTQRKKFKHICIKHFPQTKNKLNVFIN